jgi:hypothetical protein
VLRKAGHNSVAEVSLMTMRKWLRQQSEDFCAAGFDALESDGTDVAGGYVDK